jgi:hypothetical protein
VHTPLPPIKNRILSPTVSSSSNLLLASSSSSSSNNKSNSQVFNGTFDFSQFDEIVNDKPKKSKEEVFIFLQLLFLYIFLFTHKKTTDIF